MTMKQFTAEMRKQKDALLIGGGIGLASAYYLINIKAIDISMAIGRAGLLDTVMASSPALMLAKYKVYLVFASIGALAGYLIGKFIIKKKGR